MILAILKSTMNAFVDLLPAMLLQPHSQKLEKYSLKVREHPKDGPYVQGMHNLSGTVMSFSLLY